MRKRSLPLVIGLCLLIVAAASLALLALGKKSEEPLFGDKIGVVEVKGVIADAGRVMESLDDFRRDKRIRAVVVRVDSPGGAVGPSQEIYQEIRRTTAAKPVVGSMGAVAASGGIYVASACTKIVANPGTITGSIGVISTFPNMQGLFEKIGLKLETVKSGALKGFGQPDRPLEPEERAMMERMSSDLHRQFIADVARGRNLPLETVTSLADGGVFSGMKARELGLVDEMGNFQDAVRLAARLAGIQGRPTLVAPPDKRDSIFKRMLRDEAAALLRGALSEALSLTGPQYLYVPEVGRP